MRTRSLAIRSSLVIASLTLLSLSSVALAAAVPGQATPKAKEPSVTLTTKPTPAVAGATDFTAVIADADGKPVVGADVVLTLVMPAMPAMKMAEMKNTVTLKPVSDKPADAGKYTGKGQIMMAGSWNATVTASINKKTVVEKKLTVTAK